MNDLAKKFSRMLVLAAILLSVFNSFTPQAEEQELGYSQFLQEVQNDRVAKVETQQLLILGERKDGTTFRTVRPNITDPGLMADLVNHNVEIVGKEPEVAEYIHPTASGSIPYFVDPCNLRVLYATDAGWWWR